LDSKDISQLADLIVETSIESTIRFKINTFQNKEEDLESDLGI
jgi:hypothetical protein